MSDMMILLAHPSFSDLRLGLASFLACIVFGAATSLLFRAREPKKPRVSPPCERVIEQAERTNRQNGHENAGFLSKRAAFSPLALPLKSLPPLYACWDQTAASLPGLIQTGTLRATLDRMPVLDAQSIEQLPDRYLQRAATILGILSHAYMRLEGTTSLTTKYDSHDEVLPRGLSAPWTQVCRRLGRPSLDASLSYIDLVVYNFTATRNTCDDLTLETSALLVPTVNNQEERTFYGTMIEINSKVVPILHHVVEAQRSVLANDVVALKHSLKSLLPLLRQITKSLHKISMSETSKSYVDPVVWTKTVANLAIPWLNGVTGAAGTAHPFFHMMDEFLGRHDYTSKIGKEALTVRATYPVYWQQFLQALSQVSVRGYIDQLSAKDKKDLPELWTTVESEYGGNRGLLGIHRRKVYGFLSVSFRIGRNSTINGLGRATQRAKWTEADRELEKARLERKAGDAPDANPLSRPDSGPVFHFSDIIQHNTAAQGYWFTSGDNVYNGTGYMSKHPGGRQVIALCSGQDATADLAAVAHLSDPRTRAVLERHRIGEIRRDIFASAELQQLYDEAAWLGQKIAETENICRVTLSFLDAKMTSLDKPNDLTAHKLDHLRKTKDKIREEYAATLAAQLDALLAVIEGANAGCETSKARAILAEFQSRTFTSTDGVRFDSCNAAKGWFDDDFERMDAMKGLAAATLKTLEDLPYDTEALDARSAGAVADRLQAIAGRIRRLGD